MSCLSGCHEPQCRLVPWETQSRGDTDCPVSRQSPVLGSNSIWFDMYYLKTKSYDSAKLNEKEKITQREYAILKMGGFEQSPNAKNVSGMSQVMLSLLAAAMWSSFSHWFNCSTDTEGHVNTVQQMKINTSFRALACFALLLCPSLYLHIFSWRNCYTRGRYLFTWYLPPTGLWGCRELRPCLTHLGSLAPSTTLTHDITCNYEFNGINGEIRNLVTLWGIIFSGTREMMTGTGAEGTWTEPRGLQALCDWQAELSEQSEQWVKSWASELDCMASIPTVPRTNQMTLVRICNISMPQFPYMRNVIIVPASQDFPEG